MARAAMIRRQVFPSPWANVSRPRRDSSSVRYSYRAGPSVFWSSMMRTSRSGGTASSAFAPSAASAPSPAPTLDPGGEGLEFHVELLDLNHAHSAPLEEGPAAPLPGQRRGVGDQQVGDVLEVLGTNPGEKTEGLNPPAGELEDKALQEGMIPSHGDIGAGETAAPDLEGKRGLLREELCNLFVGALEGLSPGWVLSRIGQKDLGGLLDADENLSQLARKTGIRLTVSAFVPHHAPAFRLRLASTVSPTGVHLNLIAKDGPSQLRSADG